MSRAAWITFAAVSVVWGMPYLFIKVAVEDGVSPTFLSFVRVALAAAVLLPLAWRMGALRGLRAKLGPIAAFAVFEVVFPFPLIAYGEQHVSSSLAAIIGFTELTRAGQIINNATFQPMVVFSVVALIYFLLCWPLSLLAAYMERRLSVSLSR